MLQEKLRTSVGLKLFMIGFLTLVLLIPAFIIQALIADREKRKSDVLKEITSKWGEQQTITGPVLTIPVVNTMKAPNGDVQSMTRFINILPESLNINGRVIPKERYRGIYKILLYTCQLQLDGQFSLGRIQDLDLKDGTIQFNNSSLEFGLSDMKGVNEEIAVKWNSKEYQAKSGIVQSALPAGFHIKPSLEQKDAEYHFSINIDLDGSEEIRFVPVGQETNAYIESDWQHPSFTGDFLPTTRNVKENVFDATWKILSYNRNFPQISYGSPIQYGDSFFGVKFIFPVDQYQKTMRTVKYAIMFIGLTFLCCFLIEILNRARMHPIQYLLIGSALVLFYLMLLSLSEHMPFQFAYLLSSAGMILLIAFYTKSILGNFKFMVIIVSVLIALYGFLYVNLQLHDYALLLGSAGLFVILALVMYLTRNVNWFTILKSGND